MRIIRKKSRKEEKGKKRTVALFGGAFNPPHKGHVAMVKVLLRQKEIDQIWVIPVYRHPFDKDLAPYSSRFQMCRLAFSSLSPRVTVRRIEERIGGRSYTVKTLYFLKKMYPDTRFILTIGSDSYRSRHQWKKFDEIEQLADLIVFQRGPKSRIPDVSSTAIRLGDLQAVPQSVQRYIKRKGLYKNQRS